MKNVTTVYMRGRTQQFARTSAANGTREGASRRAVQPGLPVPVVIGRVIVPCFVEKHEVRIGMPSNPLPSAIERFATRASDQRERTIIDPAKSSLTVRLENESQFYKNCGTIRRGRKRMMSGNTMTRINRINIGNRMMHTSRRALTTFISPIAAEISRHSP